MESREAFTRAARRHIALLATCYALAFVCGVADLILVLKLKQVSDTRDGIRTAVASAEKEVRN